MPLEVARTVFAAELPLPVKAGSAKELLEVHTLEDYPIRALVSRFSFQFQFFFFSHREKESNEEKCTTGLSTYDENATILL